MTLPIVLALAAAFLLYLVVGVVTGRRSRKLADWLPIQQGHQASVRNAAEFSASTVATTLSLATVVLAFFELVPSMGVWLFWTVVTTSAGLIVVRIVAPRIWLRMNEYDHRPTLHEFLGREYGSPTVYTVGAVCTSLGYLGAFAVELTVGAKFLSSLLPHTPMGLTVVLLALIGLAYTLFGGFRAVIVTDRIQMGAIWICLAALSIYLIDYGMGVGGWTEAAGRIPPDILKFSSRENLAPFLIGIFIINVPAYLSDMGVWQRIAASARPEAMLRGLVSSVLTSAASWGWLVVIACFTLMVVPFDDANLLAALIHTIGRDPSWGSSVIVFVVVVGLYSAMLSTASTQLIAVSHTLYSDVLRRKIAASWSERGESSVELMASRIILTGCAMISTLIVYLLFAAGFSIADFVFSIYGAQLGLFPAIAIALYASPERKKSLAPWAAMAIAGGFFGAWYAATYGKLLDDDTLVFLAPAVSLIASGAIIGLGFMRRNHVD